MNMHAHMHACTNAHTRARTSQVMVVDYIAHDYNYNFFAHISSVAQSLRSQLLLLPRTPGAKYFCCRAPGPNYCCPDCHGPRSQLLLLQACTVYFNIVFDFILNNIGENNNIFYFIMSIIFLNVIMITCKRNCNNN